MGKIKFELFIVLIYTCLFDVFHRLNPELNTEIPLAIPSVIGTVISLLLAFKSNQAYDRWWEARIIWGAITNDSRTLIRQISTYYNDAIFFDNNNFIEKMAKRQAAWCYSLGNSLRGENVYKPIKGLLSVEEYDYIKRHKHVPNALLILHAKDLKDAFRENKINAFQQIEIDQTLTKFCDHMGKCERIKSTVFPTTYGLYIHMTIYLFIMMLPFSLPTMLRSLEIPLVTIIAATFFLVEKMAIHLQDPFENKPTDTPVSTIAKNIEKNLMQMVNEYNDEFSNTSDHFESNKYSKMVKIKTADYYIL
ncbi:bestrophin family protein [Flavobacterium adhaerens]|uniref:bestrophin family protein n=1 Tax=Flavobacterium adhaerens TaxID=3149043 RepID=UPI0032B31B26